MKRFGLVIAVCLVAGAATAVGKAQAAPKLAPGCEEGYKLVKGRCKLRAVNDPGGCPPGTKPVPETDNCVKVQKKPEFEVRPWTKPGCASWRRRCDKGDYKACGNYETNCQVN
jgi:hypothetical protein